MPSATPERARDGGNGPTGPTAAAGLLGRDVTDMLRCPACHAAELATTSATDVACRQCGASYPADAETGICRLIEIPVDDLAGRSVLETGAGAGRAFSSTIFAFRG